MRISILLPYSDALSFQFPEPQSARVLRMMKAEYCEQIHRFFAFRSLKTSSVVEIQPSVPVFLRFRAFSCFAEMFLGPYLISFVRCSDHELTHWSIIQEYLAASACFHEIVNKLYVFCFSAATHERINVTCFEREVPCLYIVWISRTFVGSKIHNNPFCKSDIFFAHHYSNETKLFWQKAGYTFFGTGKNLMAWFIEVLWQIGAISEISAKRLKLFPKIENSYYYGKKMISSFFLFANFLVLSRRKVLIERSRFWFWKNRK